MTKQEIGQILKAAREAKGLTQKQVAEQIGRGQQVVGHWETGYAQPDANTLFVLCDIYEISIDEAFAKKASKPTRQKYTEKAIEVAARFDTLTPVGQELVCTALDVAVKHHSAGSLPLKQIGKVPYPPTGKPIPLYEASCDGTVETKEAAKREQIEITTNPNLTDLPFFEGVEIRIREK